MLRKQGLSIRDVARRVGCVPSSVSRWEGLYDAGGETALDPRPNAGGQSRLSLKQQHSLSKVLIKGAKSAGFADNTWTLRRVAEVIERRYGVRYHIGHVHRMLHGMGFSPQRPAVRAREQSREKVTEFRTQTWRKLKKKPEGVAGR
jgi:transposase